MQKTVCALCCALVGVAIPAQAQPPAAPPKQPNTTSMNEVDRYNLLIREYNRAGRDYVVCINSYIRNADHDIDLIREKSRDAADQANR